MRNLKRLPDILCCRTLYENSILLAVCCAVFLLLKQKIPLFCAAGLITVWYLRTGDRSFIMTVLILLLFLIPVRSDGIPVFRTARAAEVHSRYIIAVSGRYRALVYTDAQIEPDALIEVNGAWERIASVPSFYTPGFQQYCNNRGVYWRLQGSVRQIRKSRSIRGFFFRCIMKRSGEEQDILLSVLAGIRSDDLQLRSFLGESGFAVSGILSLVNLFLSRFMYPEDRKKWMQGITLILAAVYHFPLALAQRLIFSFICTDNDIEKKGIAAVIVMLLYPYCLTSAAFLFPMMFRLIAAGKEERREKIMFFSGIMQSLLFQRINPAEALLYRFLHPLNGIFWLSGLLYLAFPVIPLSGFISSADRILAFLSHADLAGSILGAGLPFFLLMCCACGKKHRWGKRCALLYLFLLTGLFHPLPEVTFINVGQGDSILLRRPLNLGNILIDTGRPEAWDHLDSFLKAKGIRKLECLMVTHPDLDHNGNQENLVQSYHPGQVITQHFERKEYGSIVFRDLSTIESDDKNRSSLFLYVNACGLSFVIAGDADAYTENAVIRNYPGIHADVLKVSHHGSSTSSSDLFLDVLRPGTAVISCGAYSIYHHPSPETVQKLLKRHIPYFLTRQSGDITVAEIGPFRLFLTSAKEAALLSPSG